MCRGEHEAYTYSIPTRAHPVMQLLGINTKVDAVLNLARLQIGSVMENSFWGSLLQVLDMGDRMMKAMEC